MEKESTVLKQKAPPHNSVAPTGYELLSQED